MLLDQDRDNASRGLCTGRTQVHAAVQVRHVETIAGKLQNAFVRRHLAY